MSLAPNRQPASGRQSVLVLAYYFPPVGGGGVNRTLKVVRALAAARFDPLVVTVDAAAWARDARLLTSVPRSARIVRVFNPDWGRVPAGAGGALAPDAGGGRLRRWLVPDLHVGWSALAGSFALGAALTRRVAAIWSTGPPYSAHLAALAAARLGVPWVADFRDGWTDYPGRGDFPPWRRRLELRLERAVLARADRVLFASALSHQRARARCPALAGRGETVLTGFEPGEFAPALGRQPPADQLALVHAGSALLGDKAPNTRRLLDALAGLRGRLGSLPLELAFVGGEPELAREIRARGLEDRVRVEPALPREALPARLARAHRCVYIAPALAGGDAPIPGKLFDAAGADRRLLAIGACGAVATLAARIDNADCFDPDAPERLIAHLERLARDPTLRDARPGPGAARALSASVSARRYVAAVEAAIAGRKSFSRFEEQPCPPC